jgi:alkylation response protein AidB-like acyl-CoA dehydrogenase
MRAQKPLRDVSSSATTGARVTSAAAAARLRADIRELAPEITARALEIEAGRRIPPDLVEVLKSIGVFRMPVPRSHGGFELDLPDALEVLSALARIEGSVGWTVAIACGSQIFTAMLPPDAYERIFRNGPDAMIAGSIQPIGTAEPVPGGWRVSGRWPFASGCQHADWLGAFCVMHENGKPLTGEDGAPMVRGFFLPARTGRSRTAGTPPGSRAPGATTSRSRTRSSPRRTSSISGAARPAYPGRSIRRYPTCCR